MTEFQLDIADEALNFILRHNNRADKSVVSRFLKNKFGNDTGVDISYVLQTLIEDYKLIFPLGETFIALTPDGCEMAQKGIRKYRKKLSLKEQFKVAKELIAIICTIFSLIIALLQFLFK